MFSLFLEFCIETSVSIQAGCIPWRILLSVTDSQFVTQMQMRERLTRRRGNSIEKYIMFSFFTTANNKLLSKVINRQQSRYKLLLAMVVLKGSCSNVCECQVPCLPSEYTQVREA